MADITKFLGDNLSIIINGVIAVLASVGTYAATKRKDRRDDFDELAKANNDFRDEVRDENKEMRNENKEMRIEVQQLRTELNQAITQLNQTRTELNNKDSRIRELENEVQTLKTEVVELRRTSVNRFTPDNEAK